MRSQKREGGLGAAAVGGDQGDQQSKQLVMAKRRRAQDRAADAFNESHKDLVAEFNKLTDGSCAGTDGVDVGKVRDWQKAHGLNADGKVGKQTVEAARNEKGEAKEAAADDAGGDDVFDGEGVADDQPGMENPAFEDNLMDGAGGMEHRKDESPAETLKEGGEKVGQANEASGLTGGPEIESPWTKAAMAPAILEMLREGKYGDALWTLAHQFSLSEALEGLTLACERLGLQRFIPALEAAAPYVTGASAGLEMVGFCYDGLKAIGEADEAGDRDSRIALYAGAFAESFLNGEGAGDGAGAVTEEQREAVEAGRRDGAATAGKTGELATVVGQWLLKKYGSEHNAKQAIVDELMHKAGFKGVRLHS